MKVVIVGAGFGGLRLARKLNNKAGMEVLLVDKFNHHQFQPLFYQVATAGLDASNISFPLRKVFHKSKNVRIRLAELREVKPTENKILTDIDEIGYDVLVLAMGATSNFFGNTNIAGHAYTMKSTVEALQLRYKLLQNFEEALMIKSAGMIKDREEELQRKMNIVVVGAGPTGVEVSGALAEMKKYVLPRDFPELDFSSMNIYLVEGSGKTLGAMSEKSSAQSRKYLQRMGVQVMLNTIVKDYDGRDVLLGDGTRLPVATMIWAAGVMGNVPVGIDPGLVVKGNRLRADRRCRLIGYNNIYALGDLAWIETPKFPAGQPQLAPVAMQQADLLAINLRRVERKATTFYDFEYHDKGSMATIGRNLAVVDIPKPRLHFSGFLAWMIWMGLHLMLILGVKNRFFVFCNWLYNYLTYDQNLRLIFRLPKPH